MQKLTLEELAMIYNLEETVKAAERFQNALVPIQTGTLRPSVKAVKGYDNNAAKAERRRKQRAKRQRKALSR